MIEKFPLRFITIYFLPWLPIEMGSASDSVRILRRFTAQQPAAERVVRIPPKNRDEFRLLFEEIHHEFSQPGFGREVCLLTLNYLRENYAEPIYAHDLARAVGVSESQLKYIFQPALGIPQVKYLQGFRIHRAAALLNEAAMMVGFDSLSHFNVTFRSFMGVAPKDYGRATRPPSKG